MVTAALVRKVQRRRKKAAEKTRRHQDQADALISLAEGSKRARMMSEVGAFRAVPTIFTGFNRASTVGGAPLSCLYLVHGPSGDGKTTWLLGLIVSFQAIGGLCAFIDAEMSADTHRWFRQIGVDPSRCVYVGRTGEEDVPPLTYEEVVDEVDGLIARYKAGKKDGRIAPGTPLIIVVDSISRMVPAALMKRLQKDGPAALRSGFGREQANMNKVWLAELGTKIGDDDILFAVIAHELETDGNQWTPDYKVRGGGALIYDTMMRVRVTFAGQVRDLADKSSSMVGKRHSAILLKNKHGSPYEKFTFYTSNGKGLAPAGLDPVREIVHEALFRGRLEGPDPKNLTTGSRLKWKGRKMTLKQLFREDHVEVVREIARELDAELIE